MVKSKSHKEYCQFYTIVFKSVRFVYFVFLTFSSKTLRNTSFMITNCGEIIISEHCWVPRAKSFNQQFMIMMISQDSIRDDDSVFSWFFHFRVLKLREFFYSYGTMYPFRQGSLDQMESKLNFQVTAEGLEMLILLHRQYSTSGLHKSVMHHHSHPILFHYFYFSKNGF